MRNKYPNRTTYNEGLGEGKACLFDPSNGFSVTVQWNGKKYVITHAWKETDITKLKVLIDYPFVRSKNDTKKVLSIIQTNCDHNNWDYYPTHAYCLFCEIYKEGDFQAETKEQNTETVKPTITTTLTPVTKEKTCAYRMRTFKLDDNKNTIITSNWICLLENGAFFRKKCKNPRKEKCQYPQVTKPIDRKAVSYENWFKKESS